MSGPTAYKQDMPPPGGYKSIPYLRIPAKTYFSGVQMFVIYNIITFSAIYIWTFTKDHIKRMKVEDRSSRYALQPMIFAEKDRHYLKRLRRLREEEEELMKDVPGWIVGTYWGEPVYLTRPENEWHDICPNEYFAHTNYHRVRFYQNFYKYL